MIRAATLALALFAAPAAAQREGTPLDADSRVETFTFAPGATYLLRTAIDAPLAVVFAPGEAIQSVTVSDPTAFVVSVAPQADSLLVQTSRAAPAGEMDVRTQLRDYRFAIEVRPANDVIYLARFSFAALRPAVAAIIPPPSASAARWRIRGDRALQPASVSDDGAKTYIRWKADQALPAVFALNALNEEETVDAYMREGVEVIDRVYRELVFRVGKKTAKAERQDPQKKGSGNGH